MKSQKRKKNLSPIRLSVGKAPDHEVYGIYSDPQPPMWELSKKIRPGNYHVGWSQVRGIFLTAFDLSHDDLILPSSKNSLDEFLEEFRDFFKRGHLFKKFGFGHRRGILLYGAPGVGKTCFLSILSEEMSKMGGIIVHHKPGTSIDMTIAGAKLARDIQPKVPIMVSIEDVDDVLKSEEEELLEFLDGGNSVENIVTVATTNYIDNLSRRIKSRPRRFDICYEVKPPDKNARRVFLKNKFKNEVDAAFITKVVNATEGIPFAGLAEIVILNRCFNMEIEDAVSRVKLLISSGELLSDLDDEEEDD